MFPVREAWYRLMLVVDQSCYETLSSEMKSRDYKVSATTNYPRLQIVRGYKLSHDEPYTLQVLSFTFLHRIT